MSLWNVLWLFLYHLGVAASAAVQAPGVASTASFRSRPAPRPRWSVCLCPTLSARAGHSWKPVAGIGVVMSLSKRRTLMGRHNRIGELARGLAGLLEKAGKSPSIEA
jgi:hypothetical protein